MEHRGNSVSAQHTCFLAREVRQECRQLANQAGSSKRFALRPCLAGWGLVEGHKETIHLRGLSCSHEQRATRLHAEGVQ